MKSYLITILIRDGEHEYTDKSILKLTDDQLGKPSEILCLWSGFDDTEVTEVADQWYELDSNYRHFQVYSTQEIVRTEDKATLNFYGIY